MSSNPTTLLDNFRKRNDGSSGLPVFFGSFHLSQIKVSLINDRKSRSSEVNEIVMFATTFRAEYSHYDAEDLSNEH